ncbi:chemotaxis protein CheR [Stappia sp. GBMRC 2046]|uniref:protein-glutamate O-methyltransferase n=1 Tax=Stappia sediminis TaxID=2692190 RepID=A0A7X3LUP8_9HYPH|nr:protein-glutamate O-methyltransferase [Stappia sediminis]MXN65441.1 chemotaxis protein CheR [Stappia sediminis]
MTPFEYDFLRRLLKTQSGLVLSDEKQYLVESRLLPVARGAGLGSLSELVAAIQKPAGKQLSDSVVEAMTTNESFFFRDKTPFDHFKEVMIPDLLSARAGRRRVRIWCAAASSGQEPYSLAISLKEMGAKVAGWSIDILGTDLSNEILEKARNGIYSQFEVQRGLPIQMLVKFFAQKGELWQINPDIRAMIKWRKFNLLDSFSTIGEQDIVFCRNVLIYFDQQTKIDILHKIARLMPSDGYLVLGAAETVVGLTDAFQPVPGRRGLYQPKAAAAAKPSGPRLAAVGGLTSR